MSLCMVLLVADWPGWVGTGLEGQSNAFFSQSKPTHLRNVIAATAHAATQ